MLLQQHHGGERKGVVATTPFQLIVDISLLFLTHHGDNNTKVSRRALRIAAYKGDLSALYTTRSTGVVGKSARFTQGLAVGTLFNGLCTIDEQGNLTFGASMYVDDMVAVLAAIVAQWPESMYADAPEETAAALASLRAFLAAMDRCAVRKHGYSHSDAEKALEWPALN